MSSRRREGISPTLFPFLAVLVCTLGTLILFLALVAQKATASAEQAARNERQAKSQSQTASPQATTRLSARAVESMLGEERFRVEQLVAFRQQQTTELGERRDQLTHLEDHIERLRGRLKQLSEEVELAVNAAQVKPMEPESLAELRRRIDAERSALQALRSGVESKTPRVVIVPHKGPNGTDRRPVYLECTERGVTIWPEGAEITIQQLEASDPAANPLDAALRAVRLHALQNYGDSVPPYPLLIVRPGGIETYGAARSAMQDWDDQFGYELVPQDVQLSYNRPDSNLKQRIDLAIRQAVANQHARDALAQRGLGTGHGGYLGGVGDDLAARARSGSGGRLPTLSAAALDRSARSSGFGSLREPAHIKRSPDRSADAGTDPQWGSLQSNPYQADQSAADARRWAQEMRGAAGELRDAKAGDSAGTVASTDTEHGELQAVSEGHLGSPPATTGKADGQPSEFPAAGQPEATASMTLQPPGSNSGDNSDPLTPGPAEMSLSQNVSQAGSQTGSQEGPQEGSQQGAPLGSSPPRSGSQRSAYSAPLSSATPTTAAGNRSGSDSPAAGGMPAISVNASPRSPLVRREGSNWALPPDMAGIGGNAIVRSIRVQCFQDRLVLLPSGTSGSGEVFPLSSGDVEQASLRLATAVRDRIEQWGPALIGGRWEPRLDVEVMPRAEARFHQLRTLFQGSGVEVIGRPSQ